MTSSTKHFPAMTGLDEVQVRASREQNGSNLFTGKKRKSFLRKYAESFGDPIIRILLLALGVNVAFMLRTGEIFETVGIAIAVFLSTFVSTLSEYGSESAFLRLQAEAERLSCRVRRAGRLVEIPIGEVVVGDLVVLAAGEKIPADGILVSGAIHVDESALNGESTEVEKCASGQDGLSRGAIVTEGEGVMLVERVGDGTLYGKLAGELQGDAVDSPMKVRLSRLARQISRLGYTAALLIAFADLFHAVVMENAYVRAEIMAELRNLPMMAENLVHALLIAISVIVVAVPEGLPMMITIVLSSNMRRMQRAGVMVRKLIGIETAGSINLLFTDKTGTLTRGNMTVEKVCTADFVFSTLDEIGERERLSLLIARSCVCNGAAELASDGTVVGGHSTERALVRFAAPLYDRVAQLGKEKSVPFDSSKKYSWVRLSEGNLVLVKGAPEILLSRCVSHYDKDGRIVPGVPERVRDMLREMTGDAMRVLMIATADRDFDSRMARLTFIALIGIRDSLRPEAAAAVASVKRAGIQTVMVTGDNRETAVAIAKSAGILSGGAQECVLTGSELAEMSDEALTALLPRLRVVARALPTDKSRLVRLAQARGLVVGMTGDGVNDATALKRADVGFAMGSGTELAKEAGDIVILDDRFASITRAILYGRTIFHSIRKFIVFQLTMNFCAVCVSLIGPFVGIEMPVTVTQMLWINIIMDTLAGLAFAGESPQKSYMEEKPKSRHEPIITGGMLGQILVTGGYTVALLTAFLTHPFFRERFGYETDFVGYMTAFFTLFVFCGIFNAFNARTSRLRLTAYLMKNRGFLPVMLTISVVQLLLVFFGGTMFRAHALAWEVLCDILLVAFSVIPFDLMRKLFYRVFTLGARM
ncbi:MAG: calcium-translocating P-type ATPase, PMCA-type [Clostridia bacterium]|nr:calcium-translocating P-type ATPase, PMCA-type [Clostridia bacterium]